MTNYEQNIKRDCSSTLLFPSVNVPLIANGFHLFSVHATHVRVYVAFDAVYFPRSIFIVACMSLWCARRHLSSNQYTYMFCYWKQRQLIMHKFVSRFSHFTHRFPNFNSDTLYSINDFCSKNMIWYVAKHMILCKKANCSVSISENAPDRR